jgi:hypothetical protein
MFQDANWQLARLTRFGIALSPHPLIIEFSARCPGPDLRSAERACAIVTKHRFS